MKRAVIVLGHGSRSSQPDIPVKRVVAELKKNSGYDIVEHGFLQYASPTPREALDQCVRQGAQKIVIVPFFMQPGAHVTKDIPVFVESAKKQYPNLEIRVTDFVGSHPLITKIIFDLIEKR